MISSIRFGIINLQSFTTRDKKENWLFFLVALKNTPTQPPMQTGRKKDMDVSIWSCFVRLLNMRSYQQ